jgi:hypothetical protein
VTDSAQGIVLVPRAGVDVDADTREVPRQGFGRDADAIGEGCDLVEFGGVLDSSLEWLPWYVEFIADPLFGNGCRQTASTCACC